ncbi:CLUMA_CG002935, isoform A [Clunio marinus]|uniref:CLUMA_CG002935, isoform A n=1 Tax=Clunio marinus TaxID=568069 RepID=A0A1J1HRS1_9DIPT|nr:CLUMA_CG002935, isoform A [Clunio marinus]
MATPQMLIASRRDKRFTCIMNEGVHFMCSVNQQWFMDHKVIVIYIDVEYNTKMRMLLVVVFVPRRLFLEIDLSTICKRKFQDMRLRFEKLDIRTKVKQVIGSNLLIHWLSVFVRFDSGRQEEKNIGEVYSLITTVFNQTQ